MKKLLLIFFTLLPLNDAHSQDTITCSSYDAVYEPNIPDESAQKYEHDYKMYVEPTGKILAGEPWSEFVIELTDKESDHVITRMRLPYVCGKRGCKVSFSKIWQSGNKDFESFNITSLNSDIQQTQDVVRSSDKSEDTAPRYIILAGFSYELGYTPWRDVQIPNIEYLSEKRVFPSGIDVWKLTSCK